MNFILVCPFDRELLSKITDRQIVVLADGLEQIPEIAELTLAQNELQCVKITNSLVLSEIKPTEELERLPLAIPISTVGSRNDFLKNISAFKSMKAKFFLQASNSENLVDVRIMSSLGIFAGLLFDDPDNVDWDAITDLLYFSVYKTNNSAPIEPFESVVSNYNPKGHSYFTSAYFEDPTQYLYVDGKEHIALSELDLKEGRFVAEGFSEIETLEQEGPYRQSVSDLQSYFLNNKQCASCAGFRLCLGSFYSTCKRQKKCQEFFSELIESADYRYAQDRQNASWPS